MTRPASAGSPPRPEPLREWSGRGVLITGAAGGIGRTFARRASREGARVALLGRTVGPLEQLRAQLAADGAEVDAFVCDVTDPVALERVIVAAEHALGPLDVGLLCAGIGAHRLVLEQTPHQMSEIVHTNVLGTMYSARLLAERMVRRRRGWLVLMSSIAGLVPVPGEAVYSASKHAVLGFADALSMELERHSVHVLAVCPGAVRTGLVPESDVGRVPEVARRSMIEPHQVVAATWRALSGGAHRVIVPRSLVVAAALRGIVPGLVREGTKRVTRAAVSSAGWTGGQGEVDPAP